jgi:thiamine phosphate synthase YjbQ (UPF0047 family)
MKSFRRELWFNIPSRRAFINITPQVEESLKASGIKEGLLQDEKYLVYHSIRFMTTGEFNPSSSRTPSP